jgi:hypothetical protein
MFCIFLIGMAIANTLVPVISALSCAAGRERSKDFTVM